MFQFLSQRIPNFSTSTASAEEKASHFCRTNNLVVMAVFFHLLNSYSNVHDTIFRNHVDIITELDPKFNGKNYVLPKDDSHLYFRCLAKNGTNYSL